MFLGLGLGLQCLGCGVQGYIVSGFTFRVTFFFWVLGLGLHCFWIWGFGLQWFGFGVQGYNVSGFRFRVAMF